jgi:hypothetical protein
MAQPPPLSPRAQALLDAHRRLHEAGDAARGLPPEQTYDGRGLQPHLPALGRLVKALKIASVLDWGSGKGRVWDEATARAPDGTELQGLGEIWGLQDLQLHDPAYAPFAAPPSGTFDLVICTHVLPQIPEEEIDRTLARLFALADKALFVAVMTTPAETVLPSGENAHVTQKSLGWWADRLEAARLGKTGVPYVLHVVTADGRLAELRA